MNTLRPRQLLLPAVLACLGAFTAAPRKAHAFGWTQPRGAHYLRVWNRLFLGSRGYFADGGSRPLGQSFLDTQANYYLEYGLTNRLTLVTFGAPVGFARAGDDSAVFVGPIAAGLRAGTEAGQWRFAVEGHYGYAPSLGARSLASGVSEGFAWLYAPAAETHRFDLEGQWGRGVGRRGWITGNLGVRAYTATGFGPALYGTVQFGWAFASGITTSVSVQAHQPLVSVDLTNVSGVSATRFVGFAADVSYWFTRRWAVTAGIGGALMAQSNAAALPIVLGIEHRGP